MHVFAKGGPQSLKRLLVLRTRAQTERAPRVALRIEGILMSLAGHSTGEIARCLKVHRSAVPVWIQNWNLCQEEGLGEGHRSGRPARLTLSQRKRLGGILDQGPLAYGLTTGNWTSPHVTKVISEEFHCSYHPGHVRKLLHQLGYSVRPPNRPLIQTDRRRRPKSATPLPPPISRD
jgi:transposase